MMSAWGRVSRAAWWPARLADETASHLLLLEPGEPAENNPETMSRDGFKYAFANDAVMWDRMSEPQKGCGDRTMYVGTGTGMGGSGSVSGMVYTRGDKRDFISGQRSGSGMIWYGPLRPLSSACGGVSVRVLSLPSARCKRQTRWAFLASTA